MVIPHDEQEERKKQRQATPLNQKRTNANEVTVNILSQRGWHCHSRCPPKGTVSTPTEKTSSSLWDNGSPLSKGGLGKTLVLPSSTKKTKAAMFNSLAAKESSKRPPPAVPPSVASSNDSQSKSEFNWLPSHVKVASVVGKCLPHRNCQVALSGSLQTGKAYPKPNPQGTGET